MKRKNTRHSNTAGMDEHFDAVDQLLIQLRTHLTGEAANKGTYSDYLRLLDFYRESRGERVREIIVSWVDNEKAEPEVQSPA
jgi:hypothetical protein